MSNLARGGSAFALVQANVAWMASHARDETEICRREKTLIQVKALGCPAGTELDFPANASALT
jgi:hypothetical protein